MSWKALLVVLLLPSVALAQAPPIETNPPGDDKIVPLKLKQPAPFNGQLFDSATALRWANWLQQYKLRLKTDVEREQRVCAVKLEYDGKVLRAEKDRSKALTVDLNKRLARSEKARLDAEEKARNPPWYRSTWFGVGVGVVGTLVTTFAVVKVVESGK